MRESHKDVARALAGDAPGRKPPWKSLRGRIWLDHAIWLSGLSPSEFARVYVERNRSASNLFAKWRAGTAIPSRNSALSLERHLPGTLWLFDLPLFPLLADEPISKSKLKRLTDSYLRTNFIGARAWRLPGEDKAMYTTWWPTGLVYRGDIWGLFALIGMVRLAELEGDFLGHIDASKHAFRALPAMLQIPWAKSSVPQIYDLIEAVRIRMPYSLNIFSVDWNIIEALALRADFIADWDLRPRGLDDRPILYPDPVIEMRAVPSRRRGTW